MALSEYEQKMLEQLEAQLNDEDPKLVETFRPTRQMSLKHLVLGLFILVAGIGVLVGGVATGWTWLGVIGFAIMLAGTLYVMAGNTKGTERVVPAPQSSPRTPKRSFMDKQAEEWQRRRDQRDDR